MTFGSRSSYTSEVLRLRRIGFGLQSMMEIAFLLLMVVAIGPVKGRAACSCTNEFNQVCGSDGVTYSNPCMAKCSGASVIHGGECENTIQQLPAVKKNQYSTDECPCSRIYREVCGSDGRTYNNECLAECNGATVIHEGKCENTIQQLPAVEKRRHSMDERSTCVCPSNYWQVCGSDGRTYDNDCLAKCNGATVVHEGKCENTIQQLPAVEKKHYSTDERICVCPSNYWQVCGSDGRTYDNECLAKCNQVTVAYEGECKLADSRLFQQRLYASVTAGCACQADVAPVCGTNGQTYINECQAACSKVKVRSEGPCEVKYRRRLETLSDFA